MKKQKQFGKNMNFGNINFNRKFIQSKLNWRSKK